MGWFGRLQRLYPKLGNGYDTDDARNELLLDMNEKLDAILARFPAPKKPRAPKGEQALWAGKARALWQQYAGGELPKGAIRDLWPVVKEVGEEATMARLACYLQNTPQRYYSIRHFVATHGQYASHQQNRDPFDLDKYEATMRGE